MVQGELFIDDKSGLRQSTSSFFSDRHISLSLDKAILFSIGFVILFVLTFSFGFERGKRTAEQRIQALTAHIETIPQVPTLPEVSTTPQGQENDEQVRGQATVQAARFSRQEELDQVHAKSVIESSGKTAADQKNKSIIPVGKYTIQVATAVSKDRAEKEVMKLGSKGHQPFFVQRGRFFEVCVGSFDTVVSAKSLLNEFKSKGLYSDAFVRPIPQM